MIEAILTIGLWGVFVVYEFVSRVAPKYDHIISILYCAIYAGILFYIQFISDTKLPMWYVILMLVFSVSMIIIETVQMIKEHNDNKKGD